MRFRPSGRYDEALIADTSGVDHPDLDAVDEANCIDAHFAIVVTIVGPLDGCSVENPRRILKGDPMPANICGSFSPGPM